MPNTHRNDDGHGRHGRGDGHQGVQRDDHGRRGHEPGDEDDRHFGGREDWRQRGGTGGAWGRDDRDLGSSGRGGELGGYGGHGYQDRGGYQGQGYQDRGYQGYQDRGYPDRGYQGQGYPDRGGYQGQGYQDRGGYQGQGYPDRGYQGQGYPDRGYQGPDPDRGFQGQGYPDRGYQDGGREHRSYSRRGYSGAANIYSGGAQTYGTTGSGFGQGGGADDYGRNMGGQGTGWESGRGGGQWEGPPEQRGGGMGGSPWDQSGIARPGGLRGFRGKGPQGYTRSDVRIQEDINDALTDDDDIDAEHINVKVQGGEVVLTGSVPDRATKYRAEELVERISGVKDVDNQLRIARHRGGEVARGHDPARVGEGRDGREAMTPATHGDKSKRPSA